MSKYKHFFGIDVSKNHLDICLLVNESVIFSERFENSKKAWKKFLYPVIKKYNIDLSMSLFCLENTGRYSNPTLFFLNEIETNTWQEMPIQIKKSQGFSRGKNDVIDAIRIAWYAYTFQYKYKQWIPLRKETEKLKQLAHLREKIIKNINQYASPAKDLRFIEDVEMRKLHKHMGARIIKHLKMELIKVEESMKLLIKEDQELKRLYKIATSVDGIGFVTAVDMIVCTNEFKSITSPRQFACYSGVAPFEKSSGLSIHGKSKVSHFANKNSKRLLHMAAMSAILIKGELREYYLKRTENGKPKMSVLNAVRNKIIHRVFSCVKHNRLYKRDGYLTHSNLAVYRKV